MPKINLKSVNFTNLSKVVDTVVSASADLSYGRRFTFSIGADTSKGLVFNDLFKKAQKLVKDAHTAEELVEVDKFIDRLIIVEKDAIKEYDDRDDCMYKFRTFFHRLFGGAFFGTHLNRLGSLKSKVDLKKEDLFSQSFRQNNSILYSFIEERFEVNVGNQIYDIQGEVADSNELTLKIQKKEDLGSGIGLLLIKFDSEKNVSFEFEGEAGKTSDIYRTHLRDMIVIEANNRVKKQQEGAIALNTIKAFVQKHHRTCRVMFEGKEFVVSNGRFKDGITPSINIQENKYRGSRTGLLSIGTNPSGEDGCEFEGNKTYAVPAHAAPLFNEVISHTYKGSSDYTKPKLSVVREGLKRIPEWHLNELCKRMKGGKDLRVEFLAEDLVPEEGLDGGGVKRDYVANLVESLQERESLFACVDGFLKMPRTLSPDFKCRDAEALTYQNLGYLFRVACEPDRDPIATGQFFSDALFKAVLSLEQFELEDNIVNADITLKIAKVVLAHLDSNSTPAIKNVIGCLDMNVSTLERMESDNEVLCYAAAIMGDDYTDDMGTPLLEIILNDPEKFLATLHSRILESKNLIDELNGVSLGSMTDPLFHIAIGMNQCDKTKCEEWAYFRERELMELSNAIQGSLDRLSITSSIGWNEDSEHVNVTKKVKWLIEWIEQDATEAEIKTFLKFITGATSLISGKQIHINVQVLPMPYPIANSCALVLNISDQMSYGNWKQVQWDDSKESFIRNLKGAIAGEGFQLE